MPKIIMDMPEPPTGYEYTGEYRPPHKDDAILDGTRPDGFLLIGHNTRLTSHPILRRIKPATVTLTLARDLVQTMATTQTATTDPDYWMTRLSAACRAALAKEDTK